jgi:multidrug resistance protein MdtO
MVISATITMILIMTFRIPGGALGALYAFLISRDNLRSTFRSGVAIAVSYAVGVLFVLVGANLFADQESGRILWFAGSMFVVFFALQTLQGSAVATGFAVLLVNALPIWQTPQTAEYRVEQTLWQVLAVAIGTVVTISVETIFHAFQPTDELSQGLSDRLDSVRLMMMNHARSAPDDVAERLAQYTMVGTSGLRRILARSRYGPTRRDQLNSLVALTGRLVDLAVISAHEPVRLCDGDAERLLHLASQIQRLRASLDPLRSSPGNFDPKPTPSSFPLLPEMERTVALMLRILSSQNLNDTRLPSVDDEDRRTGLFVTDALENPDYLRFALRGCLAATLCYLTYEILDWRGLSTSVTTCVITALSTAGTSRQKQVLRIAGAVAGGFVLGIGSQVFILPNIDSITAFTLLFAAVTAVGAWFATSSSRLSYFGVQLALAFYLINLQEFAIQTSLSVARDRVVGILLGLSVMWMVFDRLGSLTAAQQMRRTFVANLEAIADLIRQSDTADLKNATQHVRQLREEVRANFQVVNAQADAVPFEFGLQRERGMAARTHIRSWQPRLRALYFLEIASFQYRVLGSIAELPPAFRDVEARFTRACAKEFGDMAAHLDGRATSLSNTDEMSVSLQLLIETLGIAEFTPSARIRARGLTELSRQIHDLLLELTDEMRQVKVW